MRNGSYVSVWSVRKGTKGSGNYYDVQLSCSRKRQDTGEYITTFSGFVRFISTAAEYISQYDGFNAKEHNNQPLRLKLGVVDVEYPYDKKNNKNYLNVTVFNLEDLENQNPAPNNSGQKSDDFLNVPDGISGEELPFK